MTVKEKRELEDVTLGSEKLFTRTEMIHGKLSTIIVGRFDPSISFSQFLGRKSQNPHILARQM